MQQWHIKNKQINDIICKWCYIIWFSPEMDFMPMVEFLLQVTITITCSNHSWWHLSCQWNDAWSVISCDFKNLWRSIGTEKSFSLTRRLKWTFKKGRSYRSVVLIVSMSNYTVLSPYENPLDDFNKEFHKLTMRKIEAGTIMLEATTNVANLPSKSAPVNVI